MARLSGFTITNGYAHGSPAPGSNGGESWSAMNTGLTNNQIEALAIDPVTTTTLYAATWGGGVFAIHQAAYWLYLPLIQR